jgi:hypothetical protein
MNSTLVSARRRGPLAISGILVVAVAAIDGQSLHCGIRPGDLRPDAVVAWNTLAHDIAFAEDQFLTFKGQRMLALMHLAMHDALNAIVPVYERTLTLAVDVSRIRSPPPRRPPTMF